MKILLARHPSVCNFPSHQFFHGSCRPRYSIVWLERTVKGSDDLAHGRDLTRAIVPAKR
jgi:hypothetical protein